MWALRRAANPLRNQGHRIVAASACSAKSDISGGNPVSNEWNCEKDGCSSAGNMFLNSVSHGVSFTKMSILGTRSLSSHAGAKSSDSENDVEEGFSDLELAPETDKVGDSSDDLEDGLSEDELSVEGKDEGADHALGLLDAAKDTNVEKALNKKIGTSPLFKILMEAPRLSINSALDKWVEEGNALGRSEISTVILNLRKWKLYGKALQFAEWLETNKRLDFTERDYASYVDLIAKVHGIQRAEKYIEKIPKSLSGEVIYRTLLANCVAAGNIKKSEEVFNKIRDLGFPITTFAINQLLLLYKRVDRKKIADVLVLMEKENVKPSLFTYWLLIDTKGRANDISGMEQVVEKMKADGMEPDLNIQAMLAKHYIFGGLKEKAESMLKQMEGDDIKENRYACKSLLRLYADLGKAEDVERVWKVCQTHPSFSECLAAIDAWGKLDNVENAEKVFEDLMRTWKRRPSSKYYNALLKVYANHKLLSKGKELAKRMSDNGCRIGPLTWDALVKLYVESGEVEKADSILQKAAQQNQIKPLYSSYLTVLDQYAKRGDVHNAEKIFHRLKQIGYAGRMRQYQALLQAYINAKTPAYGFRDRMKADNMFPNKPVAAQLAAVDAFRKTQISELLD
ncbi:LOW QUALITY PROTEIN: pentatricopeptide repeat-containing protein At1g80270, mitochondrial-like [Dioscorea cayenensis subsp. rotundata]|uniref:LOW QUALITY PROTEIN: pentatricopeptide repeat-containing protein At1g80270, mitochondrial-like n=1 Tax=Dioscorea cayennensis subsp. rotundata TaxID=55577 RepID=A0AB40BMV8_DIOCR|nr:LOW QUALITY PROTEIN: pentatricopeptide repeat-containing protein At1g80270, mitochondrial-like [Dioscorea cayenensis subsp. rotundata]